MLAADRRLLRATVEQRRLEIKNVEIGHYVNNMDMITQQGALVGGFAMGALAAVGEMGPLGGPYTHLVYTNSLTASTCLNIASVIVCTFCSIAGPKMALLGPVGSPFEACRRLRAAHVISSALNVGGMATFFIALFDLGFYQLSKTGASSMAVQLIIGSAWITWTVIRLKRNFQFKTSEAGRKLDSEYRENAPEWSAEGAAMARFSSVASHNPLQESTGRISEMPAPARRELIAAKMAENQHLIVKAGIACKQGSSWMQTWKPCYFELSRDYLVYYESQDGAEKGRLTLYDEANAGSGAGPASYVKINFMEQVPANQAHNFQNAKFGLQVVVGDRIFNMDFATAQEQTEWAEAIGVCADEAESAAARRMGKGKGAARNAGPARASDGEEGQLQVAMQATQAAAI